MSDKPYRRITLPDTGTGYEMVLNVSDRQVVMYPAANPLKRMIYNLNQEQIEKLIDGLSTVLTEMKNRQRIAEIKESLSEDNPLRKLDNNTFLEIVLRCKDSTMQKYLTEALVSYENANSIS